jgi:hypothetical protein
MQEIYSTSALKNWSKRAVAKVTTGCATGRTRRFLVMNLFMVIPVTEVSYLTL